MSKKHVTRRAFLQLCGSAAGTLFLVSCAPGEEPTVQVFTPTGESATPTELPTQVMAEVKETVAATAEPTLPPSKYSEAPEFTELVKAGKLAPVDERLPEKPLVTKPTEKNGKYGGTWHSFVMYQGCAWVKMGWAYEPLLRYEPVLPKEPGGTTYTLEIIPNLAETFEVNDDVSEFTFHLRKGLKWSDGMPFTAQDLMFWYEDVFMNKELTPMPDNRMVDGAGNRAVVEKIDDYTVKFKFSVPHALFIRHMAGLWWDKGPLMPKHYLQQFHPTYNKENVPNIVKATGMDSWVDLFWAKEYFCTNSERPTHYCWTGTLGLGEGTEGTRHITFHRNPYYHRVDTDGQQLPYLDGTDMDFITDFNIVVMKAMAGEYEYQWYRIGRNKNRALFFENQEKGKYHMVPMQADSNNTLAIYINHTHPDPAKRELFQNKDFRIALSHAINRQEIMDTIWDGLGEPRQPSPFSTTPVYVERLSYQYTEYDPDLANKMLDDLGLEKRDSDGWRLMPNGERLTIVLETGRSEERLDTLMMVAEYWQKVGIDCVGKHPTMDAETAKVQANEHDAVGGPSRGGFAPEMDQLDYSIIGGYKWAPLWYNWYTSGRTTKDAPPDDYIKQANLYDELKQTASQEKRNELMKQILELTADLFPVIGVSLSATYFGICANKIANAPNYHTDWSHYACAFLRPYQIWYNE